MAVPVVLRRSARLTAIAAAAASPSCEPSASPSPEQEAVTVKRGKITAKIRKKGTSILAKQEAISLNRGKISAYFGKKTIVVKKTKAVKVSKAAVNTTFNETSNKSPVITSKTLVTQESSSAALQAGDGTQVFAKQERLLKKVPSRDLEAELWETGFQNIAGVDEAGRGPLAGPVVAAACIIPASIVIEGINDSKKLSEERREELYAKLTTTPGISFAVEVIDAGKIDEVNILQATMLAMGACVDKLNSGENGLPCPDFILVDGNRLPVDIPEKKARSIVKGDATCHVIAAASILAKVTRDRLMIAYDEKWPMYGFKAHKGYGTAEHIAALCKHGPCDIHRRSFAPLKDQILLAKTNKLTK